MHIFLLGAGRVGSSVAKWLSSSDIVSKITIGDASEVRGGEAAAKISKASSVIVNVDDTDALVTVLKGTNADIVINTVGPYYKYGTKVLTAAIKAKVDYVDVCDDYGPTIELLKLNEEAKKAGITAIINMGETPGLLNLLAKYGADKLDKVDKIHCAWVSHLDAGLGVGAGLHMFNIMNGSIPQFLDGNWVNVPGGSGGEIIKFPDGEAECYFHGHPEPVTLPRYIKGVKEVTNKGVVIPQWYTQNLIKLCELGMGGKEPMKVKRDTFLIPREVGMQALLSLAKGKDLGRVWGGTRVDVIGEKEGKPITYTYFPIAPSSERYPMLFDTSLSAATGALILARKQVKEKGVFAPEGCIDPKVFFAEVKKVGLEIQESETVTVTKNM